MTRGAKGCLFAAGAVLVVLAVVAVAVSLAGGVRHGTVIQLTIAGDIAEDTEDSLQARLLGRTATPLRDITRAIDRARRDDRVSGIMATIKPYSMGFAKVQEIRDSILEFRDSGKWAHVYFDTAGEFSGGNSIYYLATSFEKIWMSPAGDVNLIGLLGVTPFLRGTLDKIGVYPDMDSIGKYKNAKDIYTEKSMTEAHREATLGYLKDWYDQVAQGVAQGRGMEPDAVRRLIDQGPFTGEEALEHGLVDRLGYRDEFEKELEELNDGELPLLKYSEYLETRGGRRARQRIAVITGMGLLMTGKSSMDSAAGPIMGSDTVTAAFREAREDRTIKAIVFRVDSPGGSAVASDLIWRETQLARESKPVIVSMSDLAASGGYWVSMGATKIVSQPATLTGSIGVVGGKMVTTGLYDWIGLNREALPLGEHATFYYDGQKYSPGEKEVYWRFMNKIYDQFTTKVGEGRNMSKEAVDRIGQGRVWTGTRAKELGLVDELGGMRVAIRIAKAEAGIPEDEEVRLVYLPEKRTFLENLLWPSEEAVGPARLPAEISAALRAVARVALLSRERAWLLAEDLPAAW